MKATEMLQKLREEIKMTEKIITENQTRLKTLKTILNMLED